MALRALITGDAAILRQVCEPVDEYGEQLLQLLADLQETMRHANGIGLAAPQIGAAKRVCIVDIGTGLLELVNPQIIYTEGKQMGMEGCLSFPGVSLEVARPERIVIEFQDRHGEARRLEAEGLLARAICHEVDHLNGVLFFDRIEEEDFFSQIFKQAAGFDESASESAWPAGDMVPGETAKPAEAEQIDPPGDQTAAAATARRKELQLAVDMLHDAAWKMELALELLQEDGEIVLQQADGLRKLKKTAKRLLAEAEAWETALKRSFI